jgi:hypothetical protein
MLRGDIEDRAQVVWPASASSLTFRTSAVTLVADGGQIVRAERQHRWIGTLGRGRVESGTRSADFVK